MSMKIQNPAWKERTPRPMPRGATPMSAYSIPSVETEAPSVSQSDPKSSDIPRSSSGAAGYDVLFVGLICFLTNLRGTRVVLFPDGTAPADESVTPHFPYIVVDPDALVVPAQGWEGVTNEQLVALMKRGMYRLPKCTLSIEGVNNGKELVTTQHDRDVPKLSDVDSAIQIDPVTADAVVRLELTSGVLEAYRRPDRDDDADEARDPSDVAVISRLQVEHAGEINVTVSERGGAKRTLRLKPGTGIALANVAFPDEGIGNEHFSIYGTLTKSGKIKPGRPLPVSRSIRPLPPNHHIFDFEIPITDGGSACGNQGCCRQ